MLGAPNNAGARAALIADIVAAAASVGDGGADGPPSNTASAPPAKARDSDVSAAGLWRADGTVYEGAAAGGAATVLFVPCPPANIHHALKRQRRLLSPKDVPRLWTLPRIAAELILALADQAVREERRARDANPSLNLTPGNPRGPAAQSSVVSAAAAGSEPAVPSVIGSAEARDGVSTIGPLLLAPEAANRPLHAPGMPPAQSRGSHDCESASVAAPAEPRQGEDAAGSAICSAAAGARSTPAGPLSRADRAETGSQPRPDAAAGGAAPSNASLQGCALQGSVGGIFRASSAAASGPGEGGGSVAARLARLVRGGSSAADVAAADVLMLEVRTQWDRTCGSG